MVKKSVFLFLILLIFLFSIMMTNADEFDGLNVTLAKSYNLTELLGSDNYNTHGIWTNFTTSPETFWLTDAYYNKILIVNSSFGMITNFSCPTGSNIPSDITGNNTWFWYVDRTEHFVYILNESFNNQSGGFYVGVFQDNILTGEGNNLYSVDTNTAKIGKMNQSGTGLLNITCANFNQCDNVEGITTLDGTAFWVLELWTPPAGFANSWIIKIMDDGSTSSYRSVRSIGSGVVFGGNINSLITIDGNNFWVVDSSLDSIYHVTYNDTTSPDLNMTYPINTTYSASVITINYTVTDNGDLASCWYSNNSGVTNSSPQTCGLNWTGLNSGEGNAFNWTVWANDSFGNEAKSEKTFTVAFTPPNISLEYPFNSSFLNISQNIYFNITATDDNGLGNCSLCGNWSGGWHLNETNNTAISGVQGVFIKNITDGNYIWNAYCNDTTGLGQFNDTNFTFIVDTTLPLIQYNNISITTVVGSQTVIFNATNYTEANCDRAWYSVFDNTGSIEGTLENISLTSCSILNASFVVSAYSSYNLTIYMNDSASNENSTTKQFSTTQLVSEPGGGGGGEVTTKTPKIAVEQPENITKQEDLQRAILFSRIYEACGNKPEVIGFCYISLDAKNQLIENLSVQTVKVNMDELNIWLENFNDMLLEEVLVTKEDAEKYNLFVGVLRGGQIFSVTPYITDPFPKFILSKNPLIRISTRSNRVLANASIIEGDLGLRVELTSKTTADVILEPVDLNFSSRLFRGTINYIDENGDSTYQLVNIRVINLRNKTTISIIVISILVIILLILFSFRKKIRRSLRWKRKF